MNNILILFFDVLTSTLSPLDENPSLIFGQKINSILEFIIRHLCTEFSPSISNIDFGNRYNINFPTSSFQFFFFDATVIARKTGYKYNKKKKNSWINLSLNKMTKSNFLRYSLINGTRYFLLNGFSQLTRTKFCYCRHIFLLRFALMVPLTSTDQFALAINLMSVHLQKNNFRHRKTDVEKK